MPSGVTKLILKISNSGATTNTSSGTTTAAASPNTAIRSESIFAPNRDAAAAESSRRDVLQSVDRAGGNAYRECGARHEIGSPAPQLQHQSLVVDVQRDAREAAEKDALFDAPGQRGSRLP